MKSNMYDNDVRNKFININDVRNKFIDISDNIVNTISELVSTKDMVEIYFGMRDAVYNHIDPNWYDEI